jgi:O-antigen/teichoic acid export membrane protein
MGRRQRGYCNRERSELMFSFRSIDAVNLRIWGALITNSLSRAVRIIEQLALIPLLLAGWGLQLYGEWVALVSIAGFAIIASCGIGHAAASDIILEHARGRDHDATKTFVTSMMLISLTIVACLSALSAVISFVDLNAIISIDTLSTGEAKTIIIILSIGVLLGLYSEPLGGVLGAAVGSVAPNFIYAVSKTIEISAIAAALYFGAKPHSIAIIITSVSLVNICIHLACVVWWAPWLSFSPANFDSAAIRRNFRPAVGFYIIFVSVNVVALQVPRLIVSHVLGAAALTGFTVIVTYTKTARSVATMLSQSMQVELGRAWAQGYASHARRLIESMISSSVSFVILLLAFEIAAAPFVITLWTRGQVAIQWQLMFALAIVALIGTYFDATMLATGAFNRVSRLAVWYAAGLAIGIGASLLALPATGNVAVMAIAMVIPELAGAWSATTILKRTVGRFRIRLTSPLQAFPSPPHVQ